MFYKILMNSPKKTRAEIEAEEYGVDLSLLEHNLSLSYEERAEQHQAVLDLILAIEKAYPKGYPPWRACK